MVEGLILQLRGAVTLPGTWQIDAVVLPYGPEGVKFAGGINKEVMPQSGAEPINLVDGLSGSTLTLNGSISDETKTDVQLWTDIITPLLEKKTIEVMLLCPYAGLNGPYLLEIFDVGRKTKLVIYDYTMRLSKGSLNITFAGGE